jgi:glycosyltransferase involved in cell wall biosynthesis
MMRDFYATNHTPYYIFAMDYHQQSAGIRVLHYLCHALNESGMEAYVTCEHTDPHLRTPALTEAILKQHFGSGRIPIMVYPEIIEGDPFAAGGLVVRWLLNRPGHIGGNESYPASDLVFTFDQSYVPGGWHSEVLHIPTCDLSIFNNNDNPLDYKRDLVCYYAHKYLFFGGKLTQHVENAVSICKDQQLTRQEIAALLRRSKYLYVYEQTAMITEALLCGCPVSVIESGYWKNDASPYVAESGVAYFDDSPEAITQATINVRNYPALHAELLQNAWIQLDRFVELTQKASAKMTRKR